LTKFENVVNSGTGDSEAEIEVTILVWKIKDFDEFQELCSLHNVREAEIWS